jgi:hypothetical protein
VDGQIVGLPDLLDLYLAVELLDRDQQLFERCSECW